MQIHTAGLVVIKDKKILLAFSLNKRAFYLPGGKINVGESATQCLAREIKEELNIDIQENQLRYYTHITAPAYGESAGLFMEQECFLLRTLEDPKPSAEIEAIEYFDSQTYALQPEQVPGVVMLIEQLKKEGLLN
jgi:8-oxo-dGTP pyrophosphatase MutT (NUDIX family)